ncbi:MAG TPA: methyltransferase domain-containing protein [Gaiellales bacterium]
MHDREAISAAAADEYRRRSAVNWETAAAGWESERDRVARMGRPITEWLVANLDLEPGATVLELASGPGDVGLAVSAALGDGGTVIMSDRAHAMIEAAGRAVAAAGATNVELRVIDAEAIALPDASVDRVVCRFVYMLVADRAAAFRETRRVLRPGGRLAFAVWAAADRNEWATTLWGVLDKLTDLPPTPPGGPGMFALGEPDAIAAAVTGAGLDLRAIEPIPITWSYPDFDAYWSAQSSLNGGLTRLLPTLSPAERDDLIAAVRTAVEPFRGDDGYHLAGVALGVSADAPEGV